MKIAQISVFIENKPGRLSEVTKFFRKQDINIMALSIADTSDFGILRLIVDDPQKAYQTLKKQGLPASITNVLCARMPNQVGALAKVLFVLNDQDINVEYMYTFTGPVSDHSCIAFKVENIADAEKKLQKSGLDLLRQTEIA